MDHKFTELIREWLETAADERDYTLGALYLLKLTNNQVAYRNHVAFPARFREAIESQLQKYYNFRVQQLTHAQVEAMQEKVDKIVSEHIPLAANADKSRKGKRDDHDSLPVEIQEKYKENLGLLQQMRYLHVKLSELSVEGTTCPDSERYPFLKELIALDKQLHKNWEEYDHYVAPAKGRKQKSQSA